MSEMIDSRQKIISQLISARLEKGLSQEQLAKLIGTQRSNICRIESGSQNLSIDMLVKICTALGKDINLSLEERSEPMSNIYNLKLYNETLLTFSLEEKGLEGLKVQVRIVREDLKELLPLDLTPTSEGILKWLQRRVIPKNRAFVDEILKSLGLSINNTKGIIDVCKDGSGVAFSEEKAKEILLEDEIEILVCLGDGEFSSKAWGCDLTYDYVKINGDYRT